MVGEGSITVQRVLAGWLGWVGGWLSLAAVHLLYVARGCVNTITGSAVAPAQHSISTLPLHVRNGAVTCTHSLSCKAAVACALCVITTPSLLQHMWHFVRGLCYTCRPTLVAMLSVLAAVRAAFVQCSLCVLGGCAWAWPYMRRPFGCRLCGMLGVTMSWHV